MNEKRECTNPDCIEGGVFQMESEVLMDDNEYRELCDKAAALDILTARIKSQGKIEEEVVYACTGTNETDQENDAQRYERWYNNEFSKNCRLTKENDELKEQIRKLQEQINQLLPAVEDEPEKEEQDE